MVDEHQIEIDTSIERDHRENILCLVNRRYLC